MRIALLAAILLVTVSRSAAQSAEPVRTMSGWMQGNRIAVSTIDGKAAFQLQMNKAEISDGHLVFECKTADKSVQAILVGTLARSANPWPGSSERPPRRQTTSPSREQPPEPKNEQTQSLYSAAGVGTGCEVLFLRLSAPKGVQVGVVMNRTDNRQGEAINQAICRVARSLEAKSDTSVALSDLNKAL